MYNSSKINPVAERYTMSPRTQIHTTIDWMSILLEIFHALRNNSTLTYNGNNRTIEYEYHGRVKQFKVSTSQTIRKDDPDKVAEE